MSIVGRHAMSIVRRVRDYADHPDPRTAACNMIALVVASNQPFYPFYIHWLVGAGAWIACWTFLSTPFFIAVPFVARRSRIGGRMLLPIAGIGNTVLSACAFGMASGVGWFLLPCAMITVLAFRRREWPALAALAALMLMALFLLLHGTGAPFGRLSAGEYRDLTRLNAWSIAGLSIFVVWRLGGVIRRQPTPEDRMDAQ